MRHRHDRHHDDDADEDQVIDLTDRLAPYGHTSDGVASDGSPEGAGAAPGPVVPTHAAILAALVDADRAGAVRS